MVTESITVELSYGRTAFLRAMLKFVLHMMQTSGTVDRMRNLIDSTLPSSILIMFQHAKEFGANIFGLAVNVMACFIHNEPTCLSILQEAKLPAAFLEACTHDYPINPEVISAVPNAFGAICLNAAGLEAFNSAKPIDKYFEIFTLEDHLRHFHDSDVPHLAGSSIDELIRHHPSLKSDILSSVIKMLEKVVALGETFHEKDESQSFSLAIEGKDKGKPSDDSIPDERHESKFSQYVDLVSRVSDKRNISFVVYYTSNYAIFFHLTHFFCLSVYYLLFPPMEFFWARQF